MALAAGFEKGSLRKISAGRLARLYGIPNRLNLHFLTDFTPIASFLQTAI